MEENENMIKLVNEEGEEYTLEILDVVNKDGIDYVVALPEDSEDEVVIRNTRCCKQRWNRLRCSTTRR